MKLRGRLAIRIAKITDRFIRKWNRGSGGVFPGYIARLIDPEILSRLSVQVRKKTIVILGTNGKTTVSNLLCHVLEKAGNTVVINRNGANMLNGIISAFVLAADGKGCLDADYACIEVDEFASEEVLHRLNPHCVVVTNLFRDQLDRFGEVDLVLERIGKAVSLVPDAVLLLNCDDPISYSLSRLCRNPVFSYGINERFPHAFVLEGSRESTFCRVCGRPLEYDFFHYGQLGIWRCPACETARPEPDYYAEKIAFCRGSYSFRMTAALAGEDVPEPDAGDNCRKETGQTENSLKENGQTETCRKETGQKELCQKEKYRKETGRKKSRKDNCEKDNRRKDNDQKDNLWKVIYRKEAEVDSGILFPYNIHNTLAAFSALMTVDAPVNFEAGVRDFDYGNNREGLFDINGGRVQLHLAKNPLGFQQKLSLLLRDPLPKDVIIQINDADVDGRDVSWLWDVDFQYLDDAGTGEIIVDGSRRYDMGLRLKYDGIRWVFAGDIRNTVQKLSTKGTGNLYIIVNYSGLYRMNHILRELQKNPGRQTGVNQLESSLLSNY